MHLLSYVLMRSSYNFGELISYFRAHMLPIFIDFPPSNGGSFLLAGTTVVGYRDFGELLWVDKDLKVLILSVIDVMDDSSIYLKSYVRFIFSHQILAFWISSLACWLQLRIE